MSSRRVLLLLAVIAGLAIALLLWLLLTAPAGSTGAAPIESGAVTRPAAQDAAEALAIAQINTAPTGAPSPSAPKARRAPGARLISGRVVRVSDGTPLPGATVGVAAAGATAAGATAASIRAAGVTSSGGTSDDPSPAESQTTTPEGSFELLDVPAGARQISVILPHGWPRKALLVELPTGTGDVRDLVITYDSGFKVRGAVRNAHGSVLVGASVDSGTRDPASTGATGRYELKDVAPLSGVKSIDITASAVGYEPRSQPVVVPADSTQVATADFVLAGHGSLEGILTDSAGKPLPDVDVWTRFRRADERGRGLLTSRHTITDGAGHYRVGMLCEGPIDVRFSSSFHGMDDAYSIWGFERTIDEVDKRQVWNGPWQPDWKVRIELMDREEAWDERGLADHELRNLVIRAGEVTRADAVLDGGTRIEGSVTDSDGKPLQGARVSAWMESPDEESRQDPDLPRWGHLPVHELVQPFDYGASDFWNFAKPNWTIDDGAFTDANGRYMLERLSPGWKLLVVDPPMTVPRRGVRTTMPIEIMSTETLVGVDVVLPPDTRRFTIVGSVRDEQGEPIDGARACLHPPLQPPGAAAHLRGYDDWMRAHGEFGISAHGGRLRISGSVLPGTYQFELSASGYITISETLTVGGPERTWVMQRSLGLHVLVEGATTAARVLRYELIARSPDELDRWRAGDASLGRLVVERNADVPCDLTITADGYLPQTLRDVLPSSTDHDHPLVIRLQPAF